jgi:putative inorganic carbon (hco3(-)) transporter
MRILKDNITRVAYVNTVILSLIITVTVIVTALFPLKWFAFSLLCLVFLMAVVVIPYKEFFFLAAFFFSLPIGLNFYPIHIPSPVFRPLNGFAIYLYDISFFPLILGWGFRYLYFSREQVRWYPSITLPLLYIIIASIAGLRGSDAPQVAKIGMLWTECECLVVFLYLANTIKEPKKVYIIVCVLLATILLQAGIGFLQKLMSGHLGLSLFGESTKSFSEMRAGNDLISRVGGTVGSPNKLAIYLGMMLPLALSLLFSKIGIHIRIFLIVPLLFIGIILDLFTFSRGGWVSLSVAFVLCFYWSLTHVTGRKFLSMLLVAALTTTAVAFLIAGSNSVRKRIFENDYGTAQTRIPMATVAINAIAANPFLGVGLGNYVPAAPQYDMTREAISYTFPWPVHNEFLLIAAELGLPALGAFLYILIVLSWRLYKTGQRKADDIIPFVAIGLLCGLIAWCIHHQVEFLHVVLSVQFWAFLGLGQALYTMTLEQEKASHYP